MPTIQIQGETTPVARYNVPQSGNLQLTSQGGLLAGLGLPINAEVVRLGNSYIAGTATAIAPSITIGGLAGSSLGQFLLFNGESQTITNGLPVGKSYCIHRCGFTCTTSAGAAVFQQLMAHLSTVAITAIPTVTAGTAIKSLSGRAATTSAATGSAGTIVVNGMWFPVGMSVNAAASTATIGLGSDADLNGLIIVPPGGLLTLGVLASTATTIVNQIWASWSELLIPLG